MALGAATEPPRVDAVELRSDAPLADGRRLRELVAVRVGEPLDPAAVARSLRNLRASGEAGQISAFVRPGDDGGVAVVFGLWARVQVGEVRLAGELGLRRSQLLAVVPQRESQPLSDAKVLRGVYRLQALYRAHGYFEAVVRLAVDVDEARKRATVTYHVDSGRRAQIVAIEFSGELGPVDEAELRDVLRSAVGKPYDQQTINNDVERLEFRLAQWGYREVTVDPPVERIDAAAGEVRLGFPLRLGPRYRLEAGELPVRRFERLGLLPFLGGERFDDALLRQAERALVEHYQERGHYDVEVELSREPVAEGEVLLRLSLEPGPAYRLRSLELSGNEQLSDDVLATLMTTAPGGGPLSPGRLVDAVLAADLDNLRSYYALQGFAGVKVGPAKVERDGRELAVEVPIAEGPRRRVVSLAIEGVEALDPAELQAALPLAPGGPFHPLLLDRSIEQIRAQAETAGYRSAQVSSELAWNEERTLVDVVLRVLEGPRSTIDRVVVRGLERTEPGVVRLASGLRRGSPVNTVGLLEAQRRLYELGVFARADVRLIPGLPYGEERDVLIEVEEGRSRRVTYGVGYDSEDGVRGIVGVAHYNLFGRAIAGRVDLKASQRESQFRLLLQQPLVGGRRLPLTYSLFRIEEQRDSFSSERRGAQVEIQRVRRGDRLALLLNYRQVEVDVGEGDPLRPIEIDRELREVDILSIAPGVFFDRRDDPLVPRRGWNSSLVLEWAYPALGSRTHFAKLFGQQTGYLDLRRFGTVAASLRLAGIEPLGSTNAVDPTVPAGLPSAEVPISERLFAGGRTSHRAYRRDQLGVLGETLLLFPDVTDPARQVRVAVGGNALALLNLDYRFPIAGPVEGVAFADVGNVWADWRSIDPSEAKVGAGVGVRYLSPIGPLRLEVGWKLDREAGEDPFVVFFSFGNPF